MNLRNYGVADACWSREADFAINQPKGCSGSA
jgi:hypothetical protein